MPDRESRPPDRACARRAFAHPKWIAVALGLVLTSACDAGASGADRGARPAVTAAEREAARSRLLELAELCRATDPLMTSDEKDAREARREALRLELREGGPATSLEAEALFESLPAEEHLGRAVMLEIAAHGRPETLEDRLAEIVRRYDPELGLFVRTEAARILTETSPERAEALFRSLLSAPPNATLPPAEILLRQWCEASEAIGRPNAGFLADLVTDFQRAPDVRYTAIAQLGRIDDPRSRQALEVVLVESGSDGYVRRKAAQALANLLPPDELCPILLRVADRETSEAFLLFLADQIERLCP